MGRSVARRIQVLEDERAEMALELERVTRELRALRAKGKTSGETSDEDLRRVSQHARARAEASAHAQAQRDAEAHRGRAPKKGRRSTKKQLVNASTNARTRYEARSRVTIERSSARVRRESATPPPTQSTGGARKPAKLPPGARRAAPSTHPLRPGARKRVLPR